MADLIFRTAAVAAALWVLIMGRDWWKAELLTASAERQMGASDYEKTVALVKKIQELDPENYLAPFIHGSLDYGEALQIHPEKVANTPELRAQKKLMQQMREGFLKSAAGHFNHVHTLYPQNPHYSQYLAEVLSLLGKWPETDEATQDAMRWGRGIRTVRVVVADICLRKAIATNNQSERIALLKEAIQHYQEVGGRYQRGSDEGLELLEKMQSAQAWLQDPSLALPSPVPTSADQ